MLFYVLFLCTCVLFYCQWVSTHLHLTNISYHIIYHIISYHITTSVKCSWPQEVTRMLSLHTSCRYLAFVLYLSLLQLICSNQITAEHPSSYCIIVILFHSCKALLTNYILEEIKSKFREFLLPFDWGMALTTHPQLALRLKEEQSCFSTPPLGLHGLF